jgi:Dinucleotide-utilizing enzymes involved in molybdopterin and thiamine biosynthesis family 2
MNEVMLSNEEIARYSRHLIMPEVGMAGQRRLKQGSVLLIGTGGLGSPLALYLAAAGVGHIGLVDFDIVDASNLQRQIVHGTSTVGVAKTESAKRRLQDLNPYIEITTYETRITSQNALDLMRPYDVIVDGTDNFPTRYLTNDACVLLGKPNVYGSISALKGRQPSFQLVMAGHATAASTPNHHHRGWCRAAPKAAFWAFFLGSLAQFRPQK